MRAAQVLQSIRGVQSVVGAFVCNARGDLLLHEMPPELAREPLRRAASRLAELLRCADLCELDVERCDLSFDAHQLLVQRFRGGLLCVVAEGPVSERALHLATRVALDELPSLLPSLQATGSAEGAEDEPTKRYSCPELELAASSAPRANAHGVGARR